MKDDRFRMSRTYFRRLREREGRRGAFDRMVSRGGVYFVWAPAVDLVKIGVTSIHPTRRFSDLQQQSPVQLYPIAIIPGAGVAEEREIHRQLADGRVRGEWFTRDSAWTYARKHLLPWVTVVSRAPFVLSIESEAVSVELSSGDLAFVP